MNAKRMACAALAVLALGASAGAYQVPHTNELNNLIVFEDANCDPQAQAEMLKALGLFLGTDKGFELDRAMSRAEAAVMLTRLLGGAQEAESGAYTHPFTDVPDWASPYVGWLYQNKLTYGVSATRYGAAQTISADEYARFLSRALDGGDNAMDAVLTATEAGNLKVQDGRNDFRRAQAVAMSVRALTKSGGQTGGQTLAQALIQKGAFTAEAFGKAAWDVLPPSYDYGENGTIVAALAGVPYAACSEQNLLVEASSTQTDLPYFYAYRIADQVTVYQVDWKTMEAKAVLQAERTGDHSDPAYLTTAGGRDYLLIGDSLAGKNRLYSVSGGTGRLELDESKLGSQKPVWDGTSLQLESGVCLIDENGVTLRQTAGETEVLWTGENTYVTQTVTNTETTLAQLDKATGKTLQSYAVPQDLPDSPRTVTYQNGRFWGEAGYYRFDGSGALVQEFDCPVLDTVSDRFGSTTYYLTHDAGKRISGIDTLGGDTIFRVQNGQRETVVDASLGISIGGFADTDIGDGTMCEFFSARAVGMQHFDLYTYRYLNGKVTVLDYEAGRPEMAAGWDADKPEAYKQAYIAAEQARLDAIQN